MIGAHGESLGGLVAMHLGNYKNGLNFLFADRTMSSLSDVANFGMSKTFKILFKLLTSWDYSLSPAYLNSNCYKLFKKFFYT